MGSVWPGEAAATDGSAAVDAMVPDAGGTGPHGLRAALTSGRIVTAAGLGWANPGLAEALAILGFDCVIVDFEHSAYDERALENIVRACQARGAHTVLRAPVSGAALSRCFDIGIDGISVPMIGDVATATRLVDAVKYPPVGRRGVGAARSSAWGLAGAPRSDALRRADAGTAIMIQIECRDGVANIGEILQAAPDVDVVIVGAVDLSYDLGLGGQTDHPTVRRAIDGVVEAARKADRAVGIPVRTRDDARAAVDAGATLLIGSSAAMLASGASVVLGAAGDSTPRTPRTAG